MPRLELDPELHQAVRKALRALKPYPRSAYSGNDMDDGLLRTSGPFIRIAVARDNIPRAARVLDTFVRLVEASEIGGHIVFDDKGSLIALGTDRFRFRLKQEVTRSDHRPTTAEKREMKASPHFHTVPRWDHRPTHRFALEFFDAESYSYSRRGKLADGKRATLEEKLSGTRDLLRTLVESKRRREAEAEQCRAAWEAERQRELEARAAIERARQEREDLLTRVKRWREATDLRAYLSALESALTVRNVAPGSPELRELHLGWTLADEILGGRPKPASDGRLKTGQRS